MNDTYSELEIRQTIEMAQEIRNDIYEYAIDHPRRIALYDIEQTQKKLPTEEKELLEHLLAGADKHKIAIEYDISEKTARRWRKKLITKLTKMLNGTEITNEHKTKKPKTKEPKND